MISETKLILASASPRRKELLSQLGFNFEIQIADVEENYPENLEVHEIPVFLSRKKALYFKDKVKKEEVLIAADTIVVLNNEVIGKPADKNEARKILFSLSGTRHQVISGVTVMGKGRTHSFYETTNVYFKELSNREIAYYIEKFQPFDKAGAYGIQEWIGMIGIYKIEGCFYNVMGLPLFKLFRELEHFGITRF